MLPALRAATQESGKSNPDKKMGVLKGNVKGYFRG